MKVIQLSTSDFRANDFFKNLREALNLTQEDLAKELNISKSSIEKYERGSVNYTFETLMKFVKKHDLEILIRYKNNN